MISGFGRKWSLQDVSVDVMDMPLHGFEGFYRLLNCKIHCKQKSLYPGSVFRLTLHRCTPPGSVLGATKMQSRTLSMVQFVGTGRESKV